MKNYNSIPKQTRQWANAVSTSKDDIYGYDWGDPDSEVAVDSAGNVLGNYKKIKDEYILKYLNDSKTIVDIGSLGGKWTQFFLDAGKIICVDLNSEGFEVIKKKFDNGNIDFYLTKGYELEGISDDSVDIVFCIDSLIRSEIVIMQDYIFEIKRVLKSGGKACIHLPCSEQAGSQKRNFTPVSTQQIRDICNSAGIENYTIDKETVTHGVLLLIGYGY